MKRTYDNKNQYQKTISEYLKRRQAMKAKYGGTPEYAKRVKGINRKLTLTREGLRRIEQWEAKLAAMNELLKEFMGISAWKIGHTGNRQHQLAKNIFYRHCMESGIPGRYIAIYCGISCLRAPAAQRLKFIRSFKTKPENKEMWMRWKAFLKTHAEPVE